MFVYSTLSSDVKFNFFNKESLNPEQVPIVEKVIDIKGKANIANKYSITPKVIETEISEQDIDILKSHPLFIKLMNNGHFIITNKRKLDPFNDKSADNIIKDMVKKDKSAPITEKDIKNFNNEMEVIGQENYPHVYN